MGQRDSDFEGLEIYQHSRSLRKKFYALARGLPEEEKYFDEDALIGLKEECYELRAKLKAYVSYLRKGQREKDS